MPNPTRTDVNIPADHDNSVSLDAGSLAALAGGYFSSPFDVLGMHPHHSGGRPGLVIRTVQPQARAVSVIRDGKSFPMRQVHSDGVFELVFPGETVFFPYRLSVALPDLPQTVYEIEDPYRFPPVLTDFDLHLVNEGNHYRLYQKLGAHFIEHHGVRGVGFALWAPNAERVSVIGDFNQWDGRRHPLRPRGTSGIWEIFIPGLRQGDLYKYEIKTRYLGYMAVKSDPCAFYA